MEGKSHFTTFVVIVILLAIIGIYAYNGLSSRDETVTDDWTPLGGELKKRYASLPAVPGEAELYIGQRRSESDALAQAMTRFEGAKTFSAQVEAANDVEAAIQALWQYLKERYPGISEQHQFDVIAGLANETQFKMSPMVTKYNASARSYNSFARMFPINIVTRSFGFPVKYEYFMEEQ